MKFTFYISGNRPLHEAALRGRLDVVKVLVEAGADVDAINNSSIFPNLIRNHIIYLNCRRNCTSLCSWNWLFRNCQGSPRSWLQNQC